MVFPGGVIKTDNGYLVSFGWNDYQCRYVEITNEFLKKNIEYVEYIDSGPMMGNKKMEEFSKLKITV